MIDAPVDTVDGFVRARPHARRVRAPQNAVTTNTRSSSVTLPDGRRQLQPQSPPMLGTFASTVGRTPLSRFKPHNSTASAANASGFVQTALSRVTRRTIVALGPSSLRRVTPDRVLSFIGPLNNASVRQHIRQYENELCFIGWARLVMPANAETEQTCRTGCAQRESPESLRELRRPRRPGVGDSNGAAHSPAEPLASR